MRTSDGDTSRLLFPILLFHLFSIFCTSYSVGRVVPLSRRSVVTKIRCRRARRLVYVEFLADSLRDIFATNLHQFFHAVECPAKLSADAAKPRRSARHVETISGQQKFRARCSWQKGRASSPFRTTGRPSFACGRSSRERPRCEAMKPSSSRRFRLQFPASSGERWNGCGPRSRRGFLPERCCGVK